MGGVNRNKKSKTTRVGDLSKKQAKKLGLNKQLKKSFKFSDKVDGVTRTSTTADKVIQKGGTFAADRGSITRTGEDSFTAQVGDDTVTGTSRGSLSRLSASQEGITQRGTTSSWLDGGMAYDRYKSKLPRGWLPTDRVFISGPFRGANKDWGKRRMGQISSEVMSNPSSVRRQDFDPMAFSMLNRVWGR